MKAHFHTSFQKVFVKRIQPQKKLSRKFDERFKLFMMNPHNPLLSDHPLKGNKEGLRAFSITGNIRALYYIQGDTAYFVDIGTHNQVYT